MVMKTITVTFTEEEQNAIREYVNMSGEDIPEIIRKIIIQEITFMKSHAANDPEQYHYNMLVPEHTTDEEEKKIIEANYNKIRYLLGWDKIWIS